eukprot:TRINITY_DN64234_c0_g1_i1.p1 TRINITY_DN64234_c0_g1~~TRINITY_DN64234_c0_g1_i1.p1  ORF type:complete len:261 (-),score=36.18 TRINITY_DN64234_c0_g1_i1:130-876(-)
MSGSMKTVLLTSIFVSAVVSQDASMHVYFGNGCFFAHQHLFIAEFEQKLLHRSDKDLTAVAGYAGSTKVGTNHSACYHNSLNFSDYGALGHAEVVQVHVPLSSLESAFSVYFQSFIETSQGVWTRPDFFDQGAEYRSLIGFPGGMDNAAAMQAMRQANLHNLPLARGQGADPDTLASNTVFVMDSDQFGFIQAEMCLQFHDDAQVQYPLEYHKLFPQFKASGRIVPTQCPPNFICNSTRSVEVRTMLV